MKSIITVILVAFLGTGCYAQKVAHINTNELVELMPEKAAAVEELAKMHIELESLLNELLEKFETLYADIQQNGKNWSPVILEMKKEELSKLEETIQNAQMMAEEEINRRELELVQPILEKAKKAINEVAAEEGYDYIIDSSSGALLVYPDNRDILDKVAKKLGIER